MGRIAVLLIALFSLAWPSLAAMAAAVVPDGRAHLVHGVMHWQEIPHHHGHAPHAAAGHDHGDDGHDHHGQDGDGEPDGSPASGGGLGVHVDDSIDSHGHLAAGAGGAPALLSGILTPPPVPGGFRPGLAPPHPALPPLPDGLFRPPRILA